MRFIIFFLMVIPIVIFSQTNYTVVKGDCLWFIAGRFYNNPFLWPIIYEANKDKIKDPHWIYPGQVFLIPNYKERSIPEVSEIPIKKEPEITTTETEKEKQPIYNYGVEKEDNLMPLPTRIKQRSFEQIFTFIGLKNELFSKEAALLAGFITPRKDLQKGMILGSLNNEENIVLGAKVFINKGNMDGIYIKDRFAVFRYGNLLNGYGYIVRIVGVLEIIETKDRSSIGEIIASFEPIHKNDYIFDLPKIKPPVNKIKPTLEDITGRIIGFKDEEKIVKPYSIAYITTGAPKVKPGDIFLIYRERTQKGILGEAPIDILGQFLVIDARNNGTSSGYIITTFDKIDIKIGEKIRLVGRAVGEE